MRGAGPPVLGVLLTVLAVLVLAACGSAPAPAAPGRGPADAAACARHADAAVLVRREAALYAGTAVPPVRVPLALAATWEFYDDPGAQDPDLQLAMAEVAAAIGDLDAQGQAAVPAGGTLMDPVWLDPSRALAAVDAVDRACS